MPNDAKKKFQKKFQFAEKLISYSEIKADTTIQSQSSAKQETGSAQVMFYTNESNVYITHEQTNSSHDSTDVIKEMLKYFEKKQKNNKQLAGDKEIFFVEEKVIFGLVSQYNTLFKEFDAYDDVNELSYSPRLDGENKILPLLDEKQFHQSEIIRKNGQINWKIYKIDYTVILNKNNNTNVLSSISQKTQLLLDLMKRVQEKKTIIVFLPKPGKTFAQTLFFSLTALLRKGKSDLFDNVYEEMINSNSKMLFNFTRYVLSNKYTDFCNIVQKPISVVIGDNNSIEIEAYKLMKYITLWKCLSEINEYLKYKLTNNDNKINCLDPLELEIRLVKIFSEEVEKTITEEKKTFNVMIELVNNQKNILPDMITTCQNLLDKIKAIKSNAREVLNLTGNLKNQAKKDGQKGLVDVFTLLISIMNALTSLTNVVVNEASQQINNNNATNESMSTLRPCNTGNKRTNHLDSNSNFFQTKTNITGGKRKDIPFPQYASEGTGNDNEPTSKFQKSDELTPGPSDHLSQNQFTMSGKGI